jgi:hypothetical protein
MKQLSLHRLIAIAAISGILSLLMVSCEYEFIEIDEPDPSITVSFAGEILPIFTNNNNCTACHRTGGTSPDLSADRAYNSIVPGLINSDNPELSRIYTVPAPSSPHASRYNLVQAAKVLNWIKQGAQNN